MNEPNEPTLPVVILDIQHTDASAVMDEFMNLMERGAQPAPGFALRCVVSVVKAEEWDSDPL